MCNLVIIREMQPRLRRWVLASTNILALYSFCGIGASLQQQHIVWNPKTPVPLLRLSNYTSLTFFPINTYLIDSGCWRWCTLWREIHGRRQSWSLTRTLSLLGVWGVESLCSSSLKLNHLCPTAGQHWHGWSAQQSACGSVLVKHILLFTEKTTYC
jgi:hypothetical protein